MNIITDFEFLSTNVSITSPLSSTSTNTEPWNDSLQLKQQENVIRFLQYIEKHQHQEQVRPMGISPESQVEEYLSPLQITSPTQINFPTSPLFEKAPELTISSASSSSSSRRESFQKTRPKKPSPELTDKQWERKLKNRASAQRSRERKQQEFDDLSMAYQTLLAKYQELQKNYEAALSKLGQYET